jgi:hypothetical protein
MRSPVEEVPPERTSAEEGGSVLSLPLALPLLDVSSFLAELLLLKDLLEGDRGDRRGLLVDPACPPSVKDVSPANSILSLEKRLFVLPILDLGLIVSSVCSAFGEMVPLTGGEMGKLGGLVGVVSSFVELQDDDPILLELIFAGLDEPKLLMRTCNDWLRSGGLSSGLLLLV